MGQGPGIFVKNIVKIFAVFFLRSPDVTERPRDALCMSVVKSRNFKSSLSNAKCNFYSTVNGIFSKVLNFASEEVILKLITTKCMPILLYGLESCQLSITATFSGFYV